jgi:hypothetical protein
MVDSYYQSFQNFRRARRARKNAAENPAYSYDSRRVTGDFGFSYDSRLYTRYSDYKFPYYSFDAFNNALSEVSKVSGAAEIPDNKKGEEDMPALALNKITSTDTVIESAEVLKRIAELADTRTVAYIIKQNRTSNDFPFAYQSFSTREAAVNWLDERDYQVTRFTVSERITGLTDTEQDELAKLEELNSAGRTLFGPTAWITDSVRLYNDEFFSEAWARNQTRRRLGISAAQLNEWPLSLINWDHAVAALLDDKYRYVQFNDVTFWGSTAETDTTE